MRNTESKEQLIFRPWDRPQCGCGCCCCKRGDNPYEDNPYEALDKDLRVDEAPFTSFDDGFNAADVWM